MCRLQNIAMPDYQEMTTEQTDTHTHRQTLDKMILMWHYELRGETFRSPTRIGDHFFGVGS